ncbi:hypothetical protein [Streptomyces sp. NPDC050759]|uniref:hypothetical protein n=1 Tax=Streptomyces sp. NPDC050759 TaxID=3365635 RepID=UPI0037A7521A
MRVVAACLRNITAVGTWLTSHGYGTPEHPEVVIAAAELWPDGSLRPALEDLLGAGAVISDLCSQGAGPLSPEAAATKASYEGTADVAHAVATGVSGRQPAAMGFVADVAIAPPRRTRPPSSRYGTATVPSSPVERRRGQPAGSSPSGHPVVRHS